MPRNSPWTAEDLPDLSAKTIIVTGGNSGLGYQAALQLARKGARVVLACRSLDRARSASAAIASAHPGARPEAMELDLASLSSVRDFAKAFLEGFYYRPRVDKELLAEHSDGLIALSGCTGLSSDLRLTGRERLLLLLLTGRE